MRLHRTPSGAWPNILGDLAHLRTFPIKFVAIDKHYVNSCKLVTNYANYDNNHYYYIHSPLFNHHLFRTLGACHVQT